MPTGHFVGLVQDLVLKYPSYQCITTRIIGCVLRLELLILGTDLYADRLILFLIAHRLLFITIVFLDLQS